MMMNPPIAEIVDGKYVLGDVLGVGGMGRVYAARDTTNDRSVAVKLLHPSLVNDPAMVVRFRDEAVAAARVSHRNVVRLLDHGPTADGRCYLVMDYVRGTPLGAMIQREGPLSLLRLRSIALQILAGVAAIHRAGLVHGDIKSDNILVETSDGLDRVTIIDFGLARFPSTKSSIGEHMVSGTPEYMAPEVIRGEPATTAADLYAVGVIVYEMLTGTTPFEGGTSSMIFDRHLTDEVVPPSLRCPDRTIYPAFEHVILRALQKDAADRHLNAELFATALERSLPATCDDHGYSRSKRVACSPDRKTSDWIHPPTRERHQLTAETTPCDSAAVGRCRDELREALASGMEDPIVAAYLGLVHALIEDHRMFVAARELEGAIALLSDSATPSLWRLELALAAVYDGLGDHLRARRTATDANKHATRIHSGVGERRASALLQRLGPVDTEHGRPSRVVTSRRPA